MYIWVKKVEIWFLRSEDAKASNAWGQNKPQNLPHEKGQNTDGRTLRLLDQIGPVGRFDENNNEQKYTAAFIASHGI